MAFVSYGSLKTTPNSLQFAISPVEWANKAVYFGYYQQLKEADFYAVVNSSPDAFDTGAWSLTHSSGEERFYLKSGAYFRIFYSGSDLFFGIYNQNNQQVSVTSFTGKNGIDVINHAGIITLYIDKENQKACVGYMRDVRDKGTKSWSGEVRPIKGDPYTAEEMTTLYNLIFSSIPPEYPWKEEGTGTGGGDGKWDDDSSDIINPPNVNALNSNQLTDTFFATTYRLSKEELRSLGRTLWTPSVIESLKSLFGNPLESIINLYLLPFDSYKGEKVNVTLGTYNTGVSAYLTNQFAEINCGVLEIPEKWGAAIDYQSRVQIYLPFIGTKEIDTAEVMGSQIGVKYIIDVVTGSIVAFISVKKGNFESVLYQFTGNCASSFPLTQASYNTFYSALLSSTTAFASSVVTGGLSAPMAISAGSSIAMAAKTHIAHSGNLAGNAGYMGIKKPYLIITRPIQALPKDFGKYMGYQSHITKRIGDCKGFTQVEYIHLDGLNKATSAELSEMENLLKNGVIIE